MPKGVNLKKKMEKKLKLKKKMNKQLLKKVITIMLNWILIY